VAEVLYVDDREFRELVSRLVRRAKAAPLHGRAYELGLADITLVRTSSGRLDYEYYAPLVYKASYRVPYCGHEEGHVEVEFNEAQHSYDFSIDVCISCGERYFSCATAALVNNGADADEVVTKPRLVYGLYGLLYGLAGAGPLLGLAAQAEEEGDGEVAAALRKLYALLVLSGEVAAGIGRVYRGTVKVEADEVEVEREVERAVELLREAKRAAEVGNTALLDRLYRTTVVAAPGLAVEDEAEPWEVYVVGGLSLGDIVEYLRSPGPGYSDHVEALLDRGPGGLAREACIYRAILEAARALGLDTREGAVE